MRHRSLRRGRTRAQAMVELALVLPVILLMALATFDLGRAFGVDVTALAAGRSGLREAILQPSVGNNIDIGGYIRGDFSKTTNWGSEQGLPYSSTTGANAVCPNPGAGSNCGDPGHCATLASGQDACFAVGTCVPDAATQQCTAASITWTKSVPGPTEYVVIRVVARFHPATPLETALFGPNIYMTHDQFGYDIAP